MYIHQNRLIIAYFQMHSFFFLTTMKTSPPLFIRRYSKLLSDQFHQTAFETIRKDESKLRTYVLFKNEIGFETFTECEKPRSQITGNKI